MNRRRELIKMDEDFDKLLEEAMSVPITEVIFENRICTKCNQNKLYSEYNFCSRTPADIRNRVKRKKAQCKACDSKDTLSYRNTNIEQSRKKDREGYYRREYNLDSQLAALLADKNNRIAPCPICRQTEILVLDHDHQTGKTRELICSACNSLIGYSKESLDILYTVIAYLKKHKNATDLTLAVDFCENVQELAKLHSLNKELINPAIQALFTSKKNHL